MFSKYKKIRNNLKSCNYLESKDGARALRDETDKHQFYNLTF